MKFYTDNTITGIERIIAQCQDGKIIELCNYYPADRWEITCKISHQTVCLAKGKGKLEITRFVQWLEHHGHKTEGN